MPRKRAAPTGGGPPRASASSTPLASVLPPAKLPERGAELAHHLAVIDRALEDVDTAPRDVAGLLRERRITLRELAEVPANSGQSIRDELTARRASRRASAADREASAAGGDVGR